MSYPRNNPPGSSRFIRLASFISRLSLTLAFIAGSALLAACGESRQQSTNSASSASPEPAYNLSLNMSDFMLLVLEPAADVIWGSAGWIDDISEGYYELYPDNDEAWAKVREHAAVIVEVGNALMLPGRAPDQGAWVTYSQAMSTAGLTLMRALQDQDEEATFQAGAQLYSVCTACHQAYNPDILARFRVGGFTD